MSFNLPYPRRNFSTSLSRAFIANLPMKTRVILREKTEQSPKCCLVREIGKDDKFMQDATSRDDSCDNSHSKEEHWTPTRMTSLNVFGFIIYHHSFYNSFIWREYIFGHCVAENEGFAFNCGKVHLRLI